MTCAVAELLQKLGFRATAFVREVEQVAGQLLLRDDRTFALWKFPSPTGFCGQAGTPPREAAMSKLWHQFS